jgi:dephospho-CoA kinase
MTKKNKIIVGVTGYLGSGKTTALKYFGKKGFYTIDADKVVHELYEPGNDGWRKINDFFGEEYIMKNGHVNRKKLGKIVFSNPAKLRILEKIIHPLVFNEMNKRISACSESHIAIEAIRFDEKRIGASLTHVVWIDADEKLAFKRTTKNRKLSFEDYQKIVQYQKKPKHIDFTMKNNESLKKLKEQVFKLIEKIKI